MLNKPYCEYMKLSSEEIVEIIKSSLPRPVQIIELDGEMRILGGEPVQVSVGLFSKKLVVYLFSVHWEGSANPLPVNTPIAIVDQDDYPTSQSAFRDLITDLISESIKMRVSTFITCPNCGNFSPPEWMHNQEICQACAQTQLGVEY